MNKDNNTRMALCPVLMEDVVHGLKKITIRDGYRDIRLGTAFFSTPDGAHEVHILVTKVEHCALDQVSIESLRLDGFHSLAEAVEGMKEYYPEITDTSEVTVIHFIY